MFSSLDEHKFVDLIKIQLLDYKGLITWLNIPVQSWKPWTSEFVEDRSLYRLDWEGFKSIENEPLSTSGPRWEYINTTFSHSLESAWTSHLLEPAKRQQPESQGR